LLLVFDQGGRREGGRDGWIEGGLQQLLHGRDGREGGGGGGEVAPENFCDIQFCFVVFLSEEDEVVVELFLGLREGGREGGREGE